MPASNNNDLWNLLRNADSKALLNKVEIDMEKINPNNKISLAEDKQHLKHNFFYTIHSITKYSCIWAAILIWLMITFFMGLVCWMVVLRVRDIIADPQLLSNALSSIWAALSGALVLGCAQLAIILVRKNTSDDS